jgi:glycine/D-amino acid oxidase-like deaminating enzyme
LLVDERPPLSLTSDKSTEAYRNWWPGPDGAMVDLMNRNIDLLEELAEESGNAFQLNRRGYLYATADLDHAETLKQLADQAERFGAGPLRVHSGGVAGAGYVPAHAEGYNGQPTGADLILNRELIFQHFPYLTAQAVAVLHVRRAGWFSGQQLGMYLLQKAKEMGVRYIRGRVEGVRTAGGCVSAVEIRQDGEQWVVFTPLFVNAAGPFIAEVGRMLGVELPVFSERHLKASFSDHLGVLPRHAPLLIWDDPQSLSWSEEEKAFLAESTDTRWMLDAFPAGVHCRPEGKAESTSLLVLWPYHLEPVQPVFPLEEDPYFPELALRGMAAMLPGLAAYFDRMPRPFVDGAYYTKTRENRLICGRLPVEGAYVIGALSGYGLMAACAAAELLGAHMAGGALPSYAPAFSLERYRDPAYLKLLDNWGPIAQL